MTTAGKFDVEREDDTIVFIPVVNPSEFVATDFEKEMLDVLNDASIKNLVIDFHLTDYFGSSTLVLFLKLRKMTSQRQGYMAFCNLSEHQREVLDVTRLNSFWTICRTREEALQAARSSKD